MPETVIQKETKKKLPRWVLVGAIILLVAAYVLVGINPYIKTILQSSSQTMFDMRIGNTIEGTNHYLDELGEVGRHAYFQFSSLIDMIFPLAYSSAFFLILLFLKQRLKTLPPFLKRLIFIPFFAAIFDILENTSIICLIKNYPLQRPDILRVLNILTPLKWGAIIVSVVIITLFILFLSIQISKNKK